MALAHRLSGIIRVATRWLRIISTNYISYVLIFLPCSDSVGETFRSVGGLGPPAEYFQWGTNIASLLTFVSGGGISDIRPARVHYLLALWGLKEPARQWTPVQSIWTTITKPVTHWLHAHASVSITRI